MISRDFSFKDFAQHDFYRKLNAQLIDMVEIRPGQRIIDLACGTGSIIKLILEKLKNTRESIIIGIDQSSSALQEAIEELQNVKEASLQFIQSSVERLSQVIKETADTIILCNAIHYIKDKDCLIEEVRKTLRPGGIFAFNTSFFEGGQPSETKEFYRRWMFKAMKCLIKKYGLKPVRTNKVEARKHLTPEQYEELLTEHGLNVVRKEIHTARMSLEGWLDISQFEDFIEGIFPGVPLNKGSASLKEGVIQTFKELNLSFVPRNWLYILAFRA